MLGCAIFPLNGIYTVRATLIFSLLLTLMVSGWANATVKNSQLRNLERSIVEKEWPACVKPRNYYDQVYCSAKVYNLMDNALNDNYVALRKMLSKEQKKALKKVQIAWLRERDDTCSKLENGSVIMNLGCSKRRTVESLYYITEMKNNLSDFDLLLSEYKEQK